MIDHNAWLGHWPFRDLGDDAGSVDACLRRMDRLGVERSWVSPFDGVFNRVPHTANQRLHRMLTGYRDRLCPLPVFNPCLPDAVHYLHTLRDLFDDLRGVRIMPAFLPGFPAGSVTDPELWRELMVWWTLRLVDDRCRDPRLPLPVADVADAGRWHDTLKPRNLVISACHSHEVTLQADAWRSRAAIAVESSFMDGPGCLHKAADILGAGRILPGSHAPLLLAEAMFASWTQTTQPIAVSGL